ncbi:hypothetical protein IB277_14005 [Ensifer sp. ENS07]|uniref:hypothetical protein n=1 Tax=unclassified Ensifer TaxID=2633371 RepID=UPI001787351D|nr:MULTISPECIES: hypothetical protein [unclassified Ensifer]MBD9508085.1 hypothetical protein [Ensifer sp. ENS10]MBD9637419.1 hypothetical protein [Ensifer sp. ENS07]
MQTSTDGIKNSAVERQKPLVPLCARWAELERQLYEGALSDAARYEHLLTTVRGFAANLGKIESLEGLAAAWPEALRDGVGMPTANQDPSYREEKVLGAAFSIRAREINRLEAGRLVRQRVLQARKTQCTWVILDEAGDPTSGLNSPYRSTEMHLVSGWAVVSMTQPDGLNGTPIYVVTIVKVDATTGEIEDLPEVDEWKEFHSQEEFLACKLEMRKRIEALSDSASS